MNTKYTKLILLGNTLIISGSILTGFGVIDNFSIFGIYINVSTQIGIPIFIIGLILSIISIIKDN